jgi:hypothetical protein
MAEKPEETEETEETEVEETEDTEEEDNWEKMKGLVSGVVNEALNEREKKWFPQGKAAKKTTSSSSPQREKETPKRRQGFLSSGFFPKQ